MYGLGLGGLGCVASIGGAGAPALPATGSLVFKLSADSLALSDGTAVSTWLDSINSVDVINGTAGAQRPTFKTALFGGKPGVRFDGSTQWVTFGRPTALTTAIDSRTYTTVVVCRVNGATGTGAAFAASAGGDSFFFIANGTVLGRYDGSDLKDVPSSGAGLNVVGVTTKPYTYSSSGGLERIFINGGCVASGVVQGPDTGANGFTIGACTAAGLLKANVDVFEILVWNTYLTPLQMKRVQAWVCNKYTQALPWAAGAKIATFYGDSITAGVGATSVANNVCYKAAQSLSLPYGCWDNLGVGGITMTNMAVDVGEMSTFASFTGKPNKVILGEYYNERATLTATLVAARNSLCSTIRGYSNTKLGVWASTSHTGDPDANRVAYNTDCVTNQASFSDNFQSVHTDTFIGISGAATANPTYYTDGVHNSNLGQTQLATYFTAGVNAL